MLQIVHCVFMSGDFHPLTALVASDLVSAGCVSLELHVPTISGCSALLSLYCHSSPSLVVMNVM